MPTRTRRTRTQTQSDQAEVAPPPPVNPPRARRSRQAATSRPNQVLHPNGSLETTFAAAPQVPNAGGNTAPSAQPAFAIPDSDDNPFLVGSSSQPPPQHAPAAVQEATLRTIAAPVLARPRSGPHSPARRRPQPTQAQPANQEEDDSTDSESSSSSPTEEGSRNAGRPRRGAWDLWKFFSDLKVVEKTKKRTCLLCIQQLEAGISESEPAQYGEKTTTGVLRGHLFHSHADTWIPACDSMGLRIGGREEMQRKVKQWKAAKAGEPVSKEPEDNDDIPPFSDEALLDAIAELVTCDDLSLNIIESPRFRRLIRILRQELMDSDIPHRTKLRERIDVLWTEHIKDLRADFKNAAGKVSLTSDLWSDTNLTPFMAVTAHWIEIQDQRTSRGTEKCMVFRAELIAFHRVPGRHTGEHLAAALLHVLDRVKMTAKIGWLTLDNASNNDTMMPALAELLIARGISFDPIERRIRCFPHITNLACKAILSAITDLTLAAVSDDELDAEYEPVSTGPTRDVIAHIRLVVRVIRASSLRRQRFEDLQRTSGAFLELLRDVDTRWSSTLLMIERFLHLKEHIIRMLKDSRELEKYALRENEWAVLEAYQRILRVPHAFQQRLSAEKTPTLHRALPSFHQMMSAWTAMKAVLPRYALVIDAGLRKLREYWHEVKDVPAYTLAMLVTPTNKMTWYRKNDPDRVPWAKDLFIETLERYRAPNTINTPAPPRRHVQEPSDNAWADEILGSLEEEAPRRSQSLQQEVVNYLVDSRTASSTIRYWEEHREDYPTIYALAMDILPIQGSAVPCERVFSSAKETMRPRRNRIGPKLMEALQMLKFSHRNGGGGCDLDFTSGTGRQDEVEALQAQCSGIVQVPDDYTTYINSLVEDLLIDGDEEVSEDSNFPWDDQED